MVQRPVIHANHPWTMSAGTVSDSDARGQHEDDSTDDGANGEQPAPGGRQGESTGSDFNWE